MTHWSRPASESAFSLPADPAPPPLHAGAPEKSLPRTFLPASPPRDPGMVIGTDLQTPAKPPKTATHHFARSDAMDAAEFVPRQFRIAWRERTGGSPAGATTCPARLKRTEHGGYSRIVLRSSDGERSARQADFATPVTYRPGSPASQMKFHETSPDSKRSPNNMTNSGHRRTLPLSPGKGGILAHRTHSDIDRLCLLIRIRPQHSAGQQERPFVNPREPPRPLMTRVYPIS